MSLTHPMDDEQNRLWNGPAGRAWVDTQAVLDQMFQPFEDLLVEAASAASATHVLDVGCGTGSTTLAIARMLSGAGQCTGIDISEPMIATARTRAECEGSKARFITADAQFHTFEPHAFDMIVSRFGVMFFEDAVAAFANLGRAAKSGARMRCIAWRSAADNPFMTTAERVAAPLLPDLPARRPGAPGQFAFADARRIQQILEDSGWTQADIQPLDVVCSFPVSQLKNYVSRLGPVGLALQQVDERTRAQVVEAVCAAFEPHIAGAQVNFTAACWMIAARAGAGG